MAWPLLALLQIGPARADYQNPGLLAPESQLPVFHQQLRDKLTFSLGWANEHHAKPQAWTQAGLRKARELMLLPGQDLTPFSARVIEELDRGSYLARKLEFNVSAESRVAGLLLVPKGKGPFPAVLALHDHGARFDIGKEKLIQPWGNPARERAAAEWAGRYFSGHYPGDELAKRGYVVLAVDALGWGDRSGAGFERDSQQALAANLFNLGSSWAALIASEDARAAKFLAEMPEVDVRQVAALGFSMGAQRAWQVAALSDAVTASIAVNWMAGLQGLMVPGNNQLKGQSSFAMLHPYLARYLDYPDVAALAAPKPMLLYAGAQDALFPLASVSQAFAKMAQVWSAYGAAERLQTCIWPGAHQFTAAQQDAAFDWLDLQFKRSNRMPLPVCGEPSK
ncbi:dienelactone hydrolase family protein [Paucibacter sp. TC2R-5]|uniref:dienelactone hydrolase family protein n=1 Tax=Paucibacter sp. TC2R-5 TaxID=2893555 RepID=UPI0021E4D735|nr:alpha/beta hydrolase family protein [Paucibacter sp. TC2R-5]MCV2359778.1 dienelactone hydrolase family protein [Paucibacter sp. TC2R-5]